MIYKITNQITGDFYIGLTSKTLEHRFAKHKSSAKKGKTYLYRAMRKYGIENFKIELIEDCLNEDNGSREKHWIATLNPKYNMTAGSTGGDTSSSPNWKEGMDNRRSFAGSGNPMAGKVSAMRGKSHKKSTIDKQRDSAKKAWANSDRKQRSALISGSSNGMFGKTPKNAVKIQFDGMIFDSLKQACDATGHCSKYIKKYGVIL